MNDSALMGTYRRLPVAFELGEGAWLQDTDGKRYLDALCGIAVCGLGHAHPRVAEALASQGRAPRAHLESLPDPPSGAPRRAALRCHGHGEGVLRQLRRRGERSGDQTRASRRAPARHRHADHRGRRRRLSRPYHGHADGHRLARRPGRLRTPAGGLRARPLRRRRGHRAHRRQQRRRRRRVHRADPGRRRHRAAAAGLSRARPRPVRRARLVADARRGTDRRRAHGHPVRLPERLCPREYECECRTLPVRRRLRRYAGRRRARRADDGQGHRQRRPHRRLPCAR